MILVTGGTGLVGSHLLFELCKKHVIVKATKRKNSNLKNTLKTFSYYSENAQELFDKIEWVDADITDYFALEKAFSNVTSVYHCAGLISFEGKSLEHMYNINVTGTTNLVNICLDKGIRLCHVSSIAALGRDKTNQDSVITEETQWKNSPDNSNYAKSKFQGEKEVWRGIQEGLKAIIVNPPIILGPGNWNEGSGKLFLKAWTGLKYYTSGASAFVDVRDVANCMIALMEKGIVGERFITSSENKDYKELFDEIADGLHKTRPFIKVTKLLGYTVAFLAGLLSKITGKSSLITKETIRNSSIKSIYANQKIKDTLGYNFIGIQDSIKDTCKIFLKEKQII